MTETLSFAFLAGTVATVNPCGFALLPAYLARRLGAEHGSLGTDGLIQALAVGGATTGGFLLVFGTVGTAISFGARSLTGALPWAGLVIGLLLAAVGLAVLAGRHVRLPLSGLPTPTPARGLPGDLVFGIGYGTASLSCTLPIFLATTGTAVAGSRLGSVLNFGAYAAGMGTVLTSLAVAAALSRTGLALALRRLLPYVHRASGGLLLLAGAYVVYYWGFFLLPGSTTRESGRGVLDRGRRLSSGVAGWLESGTGQTVRGPARDGGGADRVGALEAAFAAVIQTCPAIAIARAGGQW